MSNFDDMNVEAQLQVAYSTNARLRDQIDALNKTVWSLEERLRISDAGKEDLKKFYENQMDILRTEHQRSIDAAVPRITKSFEEQIAKLIEERDTALRSAEIWQGKSFRRKSERNAGKGKGGDNDSAGEENRKSEKADYVDAETRKDSKSRPSKDGSTLDAKDKDEPEKCWKHRERGFGQTQCVHVFYNRELQDDKAECGGLSEGSFPSTANSERRRRHDVLPAMLHVLLAGNQNKSQKNLINKATDYQR